jgi:hypothetical protein
MRHRTGLTTVAAALAMLALAAPPMEARQNAEGFAVYEDWSTADDIRSDRWRGGVTSSQDTSKEQTGRRAHLRLRREGSTGSNVGAFGATLDLSTTHPLGITRFALDARVKILELVGCSANASAVSIALPLQVSLSKFTDGTPGPAGDFTGDHFGRLQLVRTSTSIDPPNTLQVHLDILRCADAGCFAIRQIPNGSIALPTLVLVGDKVRLRLVWEATNNRFVARVNDTPDVSLSYPAGLNQGPARVPFAKISVLNQGANCLGQAGVADTTTEIGVVLTDPSAVIP